MPNQNARRFGLYETLVVAAGAAGLAIAFGYADRLSEAGRWGWGLFGASMFLALLAARARRELVPFVGALGVTFTILPAMAAIGDLAPAPGCKSVDLSTFDVVFLVATGVLFFVLVLWTAVRFKRQDGTKPTKQQLQQRVSEAQAELDEQYPPDIAALVARVQAAQGALDQARNASATR